jgi:hypothetical protein
MRTFGVFAAGLRPDYLSPKTPERASLLHNDLAEDIFSCVFSSESFQKYQA